MELGFHRQELLGSPTEADFLPASTECEGNSLVLDSQSA